jgi:hypothetical protein
MNTFEFYKILKLQDVIISHNFKQNTNNLEISLMSNCEGAKGLDDV